MTTDRSLWMGHLPPPVIVIMNDGQAIKETNYWETPQAQGNFAYLTWNAGAARLLLPPALADMVVPEVKSAREIVISRGPWPEMNRPMGIEIMFEDDSNSPYALHLIEEQTDRRVSADVFKPFVCALWTPTGKALELPAYTREVKAVPCMEPRRKS